MAVNDALLSELLAASGSADTDIGERGFRRLMLASVARVWTKVDEVNDKMPSVETRLKRLEWIVGIATTVLSVAVFAVIQGVISGRILITVVP